MPGANDLARLDAAAEQRLRDPAVSLAEAREVLAASASGAAGPADPEVEARAHMVIGLAQHQLGRLKDAVRSYRRALDLALAHHLVDAETLTRAHLATTLLSAGDAAAAEEQIDRASRQATRTTRGVVALRQAVVQQRTGRLDDALATFGRAIRWLEETGDQPSLALAHSNRAVLCAYRGNFTLAMESLAAAEAIERARDLRVLLAMDTHNLAFALGRLGRLPEALEAFDRAETAYSALGSSGKLTAVLQADRCEAFLQAGLVAEAGVAARRAVDELVVIGDAAYLTECRLLLARALLAAGRYPEAATEAERAARAFSRAARRPWAALARYVALQAVVLDTQDSSRPPSPRLLSRCRRIAAELDRQGWSVESVHVRTFAGRMALALNRPAVARAELALAAPARHHGTADLRAQAWLAEALLRLAEGDRRGAESALRRGMRVIDFYRASLGATELRVHASSYGAELARLGLRLALADGQAVAVLRWAERWRSGALATPPVRPPNDAGLAARLSELREAHAALREASMRGRAASDQAAAASPFDEVLGKGAGATRPGPTASALRGRIAELERSVRDMTMQARSAKAATGNVNVAVLRRRLGQRALVEFIALDGQLSAVVVGGGGRTRLLGLDVAIESIEEEKRYLRSALLRRLAAPGEQSGDQPALSAAGQRGRDQPLLATAARLDDRLMAPLELPPVSDLVVVPTGALHGLPWGTLPSLEGRSVTVAPSAARWLSDDEVGVRTGRHSGRGAEVALVAGPHLPGADAEITRLAELYPDATVLTGPKAKADAVVAALEGASVAHLAAHGSFRADSPLFSTILLADGPITVYDLERLRQAPATVILAACDAAVSAVRAGDELLGAATALLGLGVRSVIAPVMPVPDGATAAFMVALHGRLLKGEAAPAALASARQDLAGGVAQSFVCIGCDDASMTGSAGEKDS